MHSRVRTHIAAALCLCLVAGIPALAEESAEGHAPAVLGEHQVSHVAAMAEGLSKYSSWLSPEVLAALEEKSLSIDEIFETAPRYFEIEGEHYRLVIEKMEGPWKGFEAGGEVAIFLSHEIYTGYGHGALAYLGGEELAFYEKDLETYPALAMTLVAASERELNAKDGIVTLGEDFALGKVRADVAGPVAPTKVSCRKTPICTGTSSFSCADESAETWLVVNKVLIKTKHEGGLFAKPEVEMFIPPYGSGSSTTLIFDGRSITDPAGDFRTLPDVNKKNKWYTVGGGLAIEPFEGSFVMVDLVEDDEITGVYVPIPDDEFSHLIFTQEASFSCEQTTKDFDTFDFKINASIRCIETDCEPVEPPCGGTASLCTTSSDCCPNLTCQSIDFAGLKLCLP